MKKKNIYIFAILLILSIFYINFASAYPIIGDSGVETDKQIESFNNQANFNDMSIGGVMAVAIQAFLGLLGIIFLILIIYAGYNWMIAQGEEEKVNKAKDTIQRAVIGLIIIISAYAITYFVFKNLGGVGGGGGGGSQPVFK